MQGRLSWVGTFIAHGPWAIMIAFVPKQNGHLRLRDALVLFPRGHLISLALHRMAHRDHGLTWGRCKPPLELKLHVRKL